MSRVGVFVVGVLVAVVAVFTSAVPASAHDQLVTSAPEAGQRLETAPTEVTLTFSDEPITLDGAGMVVLVVDASGRDWVEGASTVADVTVTVPLAEGMPEAGYEVRWQVVSADGAPISGVVPFTIGDAEPLTASTGPASAGDPGGSTGTQMQEQTAQESQQALRVVLLGVGGAVIAVAVLVLIQFLRRRTAGGTGDPAS